ncbi:MAG TPA: dephospho-CoA kinase [Nitrospira sp.]|nr:dephospho-CoA kinase [Nitrospira sp.]
MILVGLTGGIATGKSTVADLFRRFGAAVIDADQLARDVVQPGKPAWREIVKCFGKRVLLPDRTIDRPALGSIVFRNRRKLRRLERIIHPRVAREQQRRARRIARRTPNAIIIYEVPLLFEAGVNTRVDKIIVVTADRETQVARLKQRNGLTRRQAFQRIRSQMPLAEKARRADIVLDGTKSKSLLSREIRRLVRDLRARDRPV